MCVEERRNTGFNLYLPTKSFDYCVVCGKGSRVDDLEKKYKLKINTGKKNTS